MNKDLVRKINELGARQGFPLFLMKDGSVFKIPPMKQPFEYIVLKEIDCCKPLRDVILSYRDWISSHSVQPTHPMTASLPDFPRVPAYLKPEVYDCGNVVFYVFAEPSVRDLFEVNIYSRHVGITKRATGIEILGCENAPLKIADALVKDKNGKYISYTYVYRK